MFIDATAPYSGGELLVRVGAKVDSRDVPDHFLVCWDHKLNPGSISLWRYIGQETISWDPTRAPAEYVNTIDPEVEGLSVAVILLDQLYLSKANPARLGV